MIKGIVAGAVLTVAAGLACAYICVTCGWIPANADAKPPRLEEWAANKSLGAVIRREAPKGPNPVSADEANLKEAVRLYAVNCAVCHGAADGKPSNVAKGLYQKPPQFGSDSMEGDAEGDSYWMIYHGIRMTGMPSYAKTLSEKQIWQLALFLKHMNKLPPAAQKAWKAVPSAAS